tara:strand:- start:89 stop:322 length:234 start_codon:yes stop_codon:yes gene_type:complete
MEQQSKAKYQVEYYKKYKTEIDIYQKKYRIDNNEELKKKKKAYYEKNREKILQHHKNKRIEAKEAKAQSSEKLLSIV